MERLTTQTEKIRIREDSIQELKNDFSIEELRQHYIEIFDKLQAYEVEDDYDMLLHLPYDLGRTLYIVKMRYTRCSAYQEIYERNCQGCEQECDSKPYVALETIQFGLDNLYDITQLTFGENVFIDLKDALRKKIELEKEIKKNG